MKINDAYNNFNNVWKQAQELLISFNCPYPTFISIEKDSDNNEVRLTFRDKQIWYEYHNDIGFDDRDDSNIVVNAIPILECRFDIRMKMVDYFFALYEETSLVCNNTLDQIVDKTQSFKELLKFCKKIKNNNDLP
jgi:hypothetical protein